MSNLSRRQLRFFGEPVLVLVALALLWEKTFSSNLRATGRLNRQFTPVRLATSFTDLLKEKLMQ